MIDRTGPFGNPFKIGVDGDRVQVIEKYRKWFYEKILTDTDFRDKIHDLKGKVLGCYCYPLPCHGMVIIEYLEGIPYGNKQATDTKTTDFFG
jgi:hypothetical protein